MIALAITLQLRQSNESCCKLGTEPKPTIVMTICRITESFWRKRSLVEGPIWKALGGRVGTAHGAGSGVQDTGGVNELDGVGEGVEGVDGEPYPGAVLWFGKCRLVARTVGMWIAFQDGRRFGVISILSR